MSRRSTATRADGRKERKVYLGRDAAGKGIRRSIYGTTDKELDAAARALVRAFEDGTLARPRAGTVTMTDLAALFTDHLEARVMAQTMSPSTRDWYLRLLQVHVVGPYGGKRVVDVKPSDIEHWVTLPALSGSTRRGIYLAVRQALDLAVRDGLLPANPARQVKGPRASSTIPQPALEHDVDLLLKSARGSMVTALQVLSLTGLRRVELLGMQWSDIDFEASTMTVRTSKTDAGRRTLPLSRPLREHLEHEPAEYLVPNTDDPLRPKDPRAINRSFELVAKRAGITVTPHQLRHGAATRLMHARVAPTTIVKIIGWTSIRMLDTYAHSLPAAEAAAMDVLGGDT